jgi:hypothetical protein
MKKILLLCGIVAVFASCNDEAEVKGTTATTPDTADKTPAGLPFTATYSSNFTKDVSDADLKMVLTSYKDWADGNMSGLSAAMGDSVWVDFSDGSHLNGTNAELMKRWSTYRDSLSSVVIEMQAWDRFYEPNKKDAFVNTWYKEIDTYKSGKVDSAYYQDINQIKNGKIVWFSQYKRPAK